MLFHDSHKNVLSNIPAEKYTYAHKQSLEMNEQRVDRMCCLINIALPLSATCLCAALVSPKSICNSKLLSSHGGSSCVFPWHWELCQMFCCKQNLLKWARVRIWSSSLVSGQRLNIFLLLIKSQIISTDKQQYKYITQVWKMELELRTWNIWISSNVKSHPNSVK